MSIPTEGPRFCLNLGAEFYPAEGDSTVPTVVFGGIRLADPVTLLETAS